MPKLDKYQPNANDPNNHTIEVKIAPGYTDLNLVLTLGATEYNVKNKIIITISGNNIRTKSNIKRLVDLNLTDQIDDL